MKLGVTITLQHNLNSIFYFDYHRMLSDFARNCEIYLVGNLSFKPEYATASLNLKTDNLSLCIHKSIYNRYAYSLSNKFKVFYRTRFFLEEHLEKKIIREIEAFFSKYKPDIAYLFPWYPDQFPLKFGNFYDGGIVVELWEDQIMMLYSALMEHAICRKYAELEKVRGYEWLMKVIDCADKIIIPTESFRRRLLESGAPNSKINVIPVCQDPITLRDPNFVKRKHDLTNEKILFYIGSGAHYHDIKTLFLALNKLKSLNIALLMAGGVSSAMKKYRKLLRNNRVKVIYIGKPDPLMLEYYLSAADVCLGIYKFIEPSGFFPGSVIKFMLAGKPIIVTDMPETREMFKNKQACLFVAQENVIQLADAIDFLLNNPEEGFRLGENARKIAYANYLWKHHTEQLIKIFNRLMN